MNVTLTVSYEVTGYEQGSVCDMWHVKMEIRNKIEKLLTRTPLNELPNGGLQFYFAE